MNHSLEYLQNGLHPHHGFQLWLYQVKSFHPAERYIGINSFKSNIPIYSNRKTLAAIVNLHHNMIGILLKNIGTILHITLPTFLFPNPF